MGSTWFDYDIAAQAGATNSFTSVREPNNNLDRDAFLKLLVTQMQYQDPLNPMDNSQMLSQMAQFSALEQMQNVSNTTLQSMAFSMIGKFVEGTVDTASGTSTVTGVVSSILVQNGKTYLKVGDGLVEASRITNVYTDPVNTINNNVANNQSFSLIGKVIQAITLDGEGNASGFVEGMVDSVKFTSSGGTILLVGDKEIFPNEVVSVGVENALIGKMMYVEVKDEDGKYHVQQHPVTDVIIRDDKAYLKITETAYDSFGNITANGKVHEVEIEKINYATDALKIVGQVITDPVTKITGKVTGVIVRKGEPFLRLGELTGINEISYKLYRNIKDEKAEEK